MEKFGEANHECWYPVDCATTTLFARNRVYDKFPCYIMGPIVAGNVPSECLQNLLQKENFRELDGTIIPGSKQLFYQTWKPGAVDGKSNTLKYGAKKEWFWSWGSPGLPDILPDDSVLEELYAT